MVIGCLRWRRKRTHPAAAGEVGGAGKWDPKSISSTTCLLAVGQNLIYFAFEAIHVSGAEVFVQNPIGVRPNSQPRITSVSSTKPRASRSLTSTDWACTLYALGRVLNYPKGIPAISPGLRGTRLPWVVRWRDRQP